MRTGSHDAKCNEKLYRGGKQYSMSFFITIGLVMVFSIATVFRMYRRTGLNGYLLMFWGGVIGIVGIIGTFGCAYIGWDQLSDLFDYTFITPGIILFIIGQIILYTIEGGAVREALSGHSILDIMLGDISPLEDGKTYSPAMSRTLGMLCGFMFIVGGIAQHLDDKSHVPFSGGYLVLFGLALFAVSLLFLNGKDGEKDNTETSSTTESRRASSSVPSLEQKKIEATRGRYAGIVLGLTGVIAGAYRCFNSYPSLSYSGMFLIALGLIAFVTVLVVMKGKRVGSQFRCVL